MECILSFISRKLSPINHVSASHVHGHPQIFGTDNKSRFSPSRKEAARNLSFLGALIKSWPRFDSFRPLRRSEASKRASRSLQICSKITQLLSIEISMFDKPFFSFVLHFLFWQTNTNTAVKDSNATTCEIIIFYIIIKSSFKQFSFCFSSWIEKDKDI